MTGYVIHGQAAHSELHEQALNLFQYLLAFHFHAAKLEVKNFGNVFKEKSFQCLQSFNKPAVCLFLIPVIIAVKPIKKAEKLNIPAADRSFTLRQLTLA
jgi:hypothetical protein